MIGTKHAWESEEQEEDILDRFLKVKKFADNRIVSCESKSILFWKFNNIVSCESKSICFADVKVSFPVKVSQFVWEL